MLLLTTGAEVVPNIASSLASSPYSSFFYCKGNELSLTGCMQELISSYPSFAFFQTYLAVQCKRKWLMAVLSHQFDLFISHSAIAATSYWTDTWSCSIEGDIRLRQGHTEQEGRVEYCLDGVWTSLCEPFWREVDAAVACKQLGLEYSSIQRYFSSFNLCWMQCIYFLFRCWGGILGTNRESRSTWSTSIRLYRRRVCSFGMPHLFWGVLQLHPLWHTWKGLHGLV